MAVYGRLPAANAASEEKEGINTKLVFSLLQLTEPVPRGARGLSIAGKGVI